jgi:hypothetical protein
MFWKNILPSSSGLKIKPCKKPARAGSKQFCPGDEGSYVPLTCQVDFYHTIQQYILEDSNFHKIIDYYFLEKISNIIFQYCLGS